MGWEWGDDDLARLRTALEEIGATSGPLRARRMGDGHSNLTYLVEDGARRVVVRRPPPPPRPRGANDVRREGRIMRALADTAVPVPQVLAILEPDGVLDVPVLVTAFVEGDVVGAVSPPSLADAAARRSVALALVDALAALHALRPADVRLEDLGRHDDVNVRQVTRMLRVLGESAPVDVVRLGAVLAATAPTPTAARIVHNDFRIGNTIVGTEPAPAVRAVLDWELTTIGDPLADLGYLLASVPDPERPVTPVQRLGLALAEPGYPAAAELAARYAERSGADLDALPWHLAFADFKLAVLFEYARRRGDDPYYTSELVTELVGSAERRVAALKDSVAPFGLKV